MCGTGGAKDREPKSRGTHVDPHEPSRLRGSSAPGTSSLGGERKKLPDPVRQIVVTAVRLPRLASFGRLTQPNPNGGTEWRALIDVDAAEEHESGYSFGRGFCGMLPRHHGRGIAADHGQALVRHVADRRAREDVGWPRLRRDMRWLRRTYSAERVRTRGRNAGRAHPAVPHRVPGSLAGVAESDAATNVEPGPPREGNDPFRANGRVPLAALIPFADGSQTHRRGSDSDHPSDIRPYPSLRCTPPEAPERERT